MRFACSRQSSSIMVFLLLYECLSRISCMPSFIHYIYNTLPEGFTGIIPAICWWNVLTFRIFCLLKIFITLPGKCLHNRLFQEGWTILILFNWLPVMLFFHVLKNTWHVVYHPLGYIKLFIWCLVHWHLWAFTFLHINSVYMLNSYPLFKCTNQWRKLLFYLSISTKFWHAKLWH